MEEINEKVKITILKTTLDVELAEEYGAKGLKACPMLKAGEGNAEEEEWYFSVVDVTSVLSGSLDGRKYWNKLKQ